MTNSETTNVVPMIPVLAPKEAAAKLKRHLQTVFKGTKFSARLSRGAGCESTVTVRWEGGPSIADVDAIAQQYSGKSFDGMDDSTHYHRAIVTLPDGFKFESRLGYVFTTRSGSI